MESMISSIPVSDLEVEVSSKAKRRVFTAKYKAKILREAESCAGKRGALGALLRREGLYSSHLTAWRKEAEAGLEAKKRGPKAKVDARDQRIAQLERQLRRSTERAERAEALVELQKKVSQLMGIALPEPPSEDS
jgi:transposase-like protein